MMKDKMSELDMKSGLSKTIETDNDYYRSIIENNSFYVIKTDLEGNYTYLNPFFCQRLNLHAADWIGRPSLNLIIPEDHGICIEAVERCFANPGQSQWVILRKPHVIDGIISTQWEFKTLQDELGNPVELLCIGHDITSLIMRQEELQALVEVTAEQNKKLVNFTYIISHNIRSHVANIIGIIALNDTDNEESRAETWDIITKSITNLDATIHNLNDIISIQSNTNLPIKEILLKQEIERVISSINVLFTHANTKIKYNFADDLSLETNPAYLESIILNLLTNALKYKSPSRSLEIDISFYKQENYKVLEFKDNGIGIDLNLYGSKIFGMYKTFNGNSDAKGLGLFIIKTQIEALGGKIEVESKLKKFTTFKIHFKDPVAL